MAGKGAKIAVAVLAASLVFCGAAVFGETWEGNSEIEVGSESDHILIFPDVARTPLLENMGDITSTVPVDVPAVTEGTWFGDTGITYTTPVDWTGRRRAVEVSIIQVRNYAGTNPLNQDEPVNNTDGATYGTLEETLVASTQDTGTAAGTDTGGGEGGSGGNVPALSPCVGASAPMYDQGFMYQVWMNLPPDLSSCLLTGDPAQVDENEVTFDAAQQMAGNPSAPRSWFSSSNKWDVSPYSGTIVDGQVITVTLTARQGSNAVLRVQFKFTANGPGYDIHIISITRIQ